MFIEVADIISPEQAREEVSLPKALKDIKRRRDGEIKDIIAGRDKRILFIIGPCSADNEDSVCDYVSRLAAVADKIKDKILVIPRLYTNKPRTRGDGYKGMLHCPDPDNGITDIQAGILAIRRMHIRIMSETGLSAADEMLYPDNAAYCDDLLSYTTIGARSSENQQHRLVASGIETPVGIKNPMNGSFKVLLNSIYAAQIANEFKYGYKQVRTTGNDYAHAVLRGSVDVYGNNMPNYHYEDVLRFNDMYAAEGLKNMAVIIDTNHSNSGKNPFEQVRIAKEVANNMRNCPVFKSLVKGFLVESYIEDGCQKPGGGVYGQSITDACLGWNKTEKLLLDIADML